MWISSMEKKNENNERCTEWKDGLGGLVVMDSK